MTGYASFAERIIASGILRDPWVDGVPRFRAEPLIVTEARYGELCRAAEAVAEACHALALLLVDEPELLDVALGLTPYQRAMWTASAPAWHGVARVDAFFTADGVAIAKSTATRPRAKPKPSSSGSSRRALRA